MGASWISGASDFSSCCFCFFSFFSFFFFFPSPSCFSSVDAAPLETESPLSFFPSAPSSSLSSPSPSSSLVSAENDTLFSFFCFFFFAGSSSTAAAESPLPSSSSSNRLFFLFSFFSFFFSFTSACFTDSSCSSTPCPWSSCCSVASSLAYLSLRPSFFHAGTCVWVSIAIEWAVYIVCVNTE